MRAQSLRVGSVLCPGRPQCEQCGSQPCVHCTCQVRPDLSPPTGTMARSGVLLVLLLLPPQLQLGPVGTARSPGFGRSGAHSLSPEENEFVEEEPVLVLSPEEPGPGPATINCPRDCACSQEGVVDCGGIDLREFPGDLPEHTNHLSLQVTRALQSRSQGWAPKLVAPVPTHNAHSPLLVQTPRHRALGHSLLRRPGHRVLCYYNCFVLLGGVWAKTHK